MPADDCPAPCSEVRLSERFPDLLAMQGTDPLQDNKIGMHFFVQWGFPVSPYPAFVRNFLRTKVWPLWLNEPETNGVFMDRAFLWTSIMMPMWIYLLVFVDYSNNKLWFACCYAVYALLCADQFVSYVSALHCVVHRSIFKTKSSAVARCLKLFFVWIIGPMMGETPETYNAHHVNMHHPTNNGADDLSSTMTYRRDSVRDFLRYLVVFIPVHKKLWDFFMHRKQAKMAHRFVTGEVVWFSSAVLIGVYRPFACGLLFVLPILLLRCAMTAGNWGQHAFINPKNPFINVNHSAVIINSMYNQVAFNDGYHLQHHEYSLAAYHELPRLFNKMLPAMAEHDSIVFDARGNPAMFDWVSLWGHLMNQRYELLADHFVDCRAHVTGTKRRPTEDIIALLKERTRTVFDSTGHICRETD